MRTVACLIVGCVVAEGVVAGRPEPARAVPSQPYGVGVPPAFAHLASASCSASACHGGGKVGQVGSEHSTWAQDLTIAPGDAHDPHAKAYRALFNEDSVRIARLLGRGPAHKDSLCLKCHAPAGVENEAAAAEGVGCSACHGPAEKWVGVHYLPAWKELSGHQKWTEYGFLPTKNLVARASNCATCHVGSADREVNHDLIAAGHPRLAFEYTRFHFQGSYRKHWEERIPQPDFEVRAWAIGQAASLRAAVDLLRSRAEKARADMAPWPEFAGYSCYACHQSIGKGESKPLVAVPDRTLGWPGWEVWYTAAAGVAAGQMPSLFEGTEAGSFTQLAALKKLMGKPNPKPADVAKQAAASVAELDAWLVAVQTAEDRGLARVPPEFAPKLVQALAGNILSADRTALRDHDWDALAANYLGCAAAYHAAGRSKANPAWAGPLRAIQNDLRFPRIGGERFDSPAEFDRQKLEHVRENFLHLRSATTGGGN